MLVIIGLLVGGILVGRDMIAFAQIRGTISQMEQYKTAYRTFFLKYNCIPGDCLEASTLGLQATYPGDSGNGNGDGLIYPFVDGTVLANGRPVYEEVWNAIGHLQQAGLIKEGFQFTASATASVNNFLKTGVGGLYFAAFTPYWSTTSGGNYLITAGYSVNSNDFQQAANVFTPYQAFQIDSKIDDGLPMSGRVRAGDNAHCCQTITGYPAPPATYLPGFNYPISSSIAGPTGIACINDSVTPALYDVLGEKTKTGTGFASTGNRICSLQMPVN